MNPQTRRFELAGPAGRITCAEDERDGGERGVAVICHPHPQHGGTMDNKVVQTLARSFLQLGWRTVRFNFRGVGESAGQWSEGIGEIDDACAVLAAMRRAHAHAQPSPAPAHAPLIAAIVTCGTSCSSVVRWNHSGSRRSSASSLV